MGKEAWVRVIRMEPKPEQIIVKGFVERVRMVTLRQTWTDGSVAGCCQKGFSFDNGVYNCRLHSSNRNRVVDKTE